MNSILKSFTLPAIALLVGVSSASAQIMVPNASFESPAETSDTFSPAGPDFPPPNPQNNDPSSSLITGWTSALGLYGYGITGLAYEPGGSQYDGVTGVTGSQAAVLFPYYGYVGATLITNDAVTTVAANTTYNLTVDAAIPTSLAFGINNNTPSDSSTFALQLIDSDGNIFASKTISQTAISVGSFSTLSLTFTSGAAPSDLNEGLKIEFYDQNSGGNQNGVDQDSHNAIELDNVTLSVPEPSTYAMVLAGMGALVFFARRKLA